MKKILLFILLLITWFQVFSLVAFAANSCWDKANDPNSSDLSSMLKECQPDNTLEWKSKKELLNLWGLVTISTTSNEWYDLENVKTKLLTTQEKLVLLASLLAIWGLVYAWIMFTTAYWDDAKHKKWKEAIKWSIIWFIVAIISLQLINATINFIYWLSQK